MGDETKPAPVTDSRFAGFNPEVEASHAAAATPLPTSTTSAPAPPLATAPARTPAVILDDIETWVRNTFGSHARFEELWNELKAAISNA